MFFEGIKKDETFKQFAPSKAVFMNGKFCRKDAAIITILYKNSCFRCLKKIC